MNKKSRLLPLVLVIAVVLSIGQAFGAFPNSLNLKAEKNVGVALAAETSGNPIFLPYLFRGLSTISTFGIDMGPITPGNGLDEMVDAGSVWVRRGNYLWPSVEPNKGDRKWEAMASFESELITANAKGLKTILVIQNAPSWAQKVPGSVCGPVKSEEFAAYASFVKDVVLRYSQPPYNVKYYELMNEPDAPITTEDTVFGCWGDWSDPTYFGGGYYGEMLKAVYPQVKSANSEAKLLIGGLLMDCDPVNPPAGKDCTSSKFLEGILASGAGASFDVMSFHTYDFYYLEKGQFGNTNWHTGWDTTGSPAITAKLAYIRSMFNKYNVPIKPIFATEVALLCDDRVATCDQNFEITKASNLIQSYVFAIANNVQATIWYDIYGSWRNNGLLDPVDRSPLPAYYAYKAAQSQLGGATYVREVTNYKDAKVFEFDRGDRLVWVMWLTKTGTQNVTLPGAPMAVWDYQGNALAKQSTLGLTNLPVFVELGK